ncbi:MAG TPA: HepT-like ribonuclease domain-containing protein [Candidatus Methylacidiphilales bacterium]|jgi:uncharacterized protein with HEPN domain|nr:HepT-like ribonuclease domain-containing protein [Candidatus Methylacidiphilales bacterium]
MPKSGSDRDEAHLDDMLEAARLIRGYMRHVTFEQFWEDNEKRDAVALRLTVIGEAASRVSPQTQKTLPTIPFKPIRGLRNRIVHDYGSIDFRIVWQVTQAEIAPLIRALEERRGKKSSRP